jgi:prevent-host-death family protein
MAPGRSATSARNSSISDVEQAMAGLYCSEYDYIGESMDRSISAAEANRHFSRVLREVRDGLSYVVTSHGEPVARIVPATGEDPVRSKAMDALLARLRTRAAIDIGKWTRDELYDETL